MPKDIKEHEGIKTYERNRKAKNRTFMLYDGDRELLKWGAEFLGCSQSEFMRSAIRAYAMHLQAIAKKP